MATTAATSRSVSSSPSATLRAGKVSALRNRMGRFGRRAAVSLSMMQAVPQTRIDEGAYRTDPVAQLAASRHTAQRYANPAAMMPNLRATQAESRVEFTDRSAEEDEEMEQMAHIADENDAAQSMAGAIRARSQARSAQSDADQNLFQRMQAEVEEMFAAWKSQLIEKGLSVVDQGEMLEIGDAAGNTTSFAHQLLNFFSTGLSDNTKHVLTKAGFPIFKKGSAVEIFAKVGTIIQFFAMSGKIVLVLFIVTFVILADYTMAKTVMDALGGIGSLLPH